ncbi:hypothetical protein BDZ90DRAFT_277965 [Jaminaea rosea]|uniref:Uncharacterized protein n=1 Tax=Jaminaea rosea TaxID=1569628 RepID=A0A316UY43_9BASI|nr:hypothetical protein BDZ90DRAFT_277965 [Jaminaea rosea]PWN29708.1 hypothetical protein BDZ90DRAFT_277965 [Jaminaea rosea]
MAPTRASVDTSDEKVRPRQDTILDFEDRSHQVLLTGFGLFKGHESSNPSWEAVKQLQGTTLSSFGSIPATVQCINLPVVYSATLDTVPRLHGNLPSSPYAQPGFDERGPRDGSQGDGRSLPEGYDGLALPARGWAAVIHVGVGASGAFKLETLGHKRGYRSRDAFSKLPPSMSAPSRLRRFFGWCLCCRVFAPLYLLGRTVGLVLPSKWRSALWARIQSLLSGVDQHAERGFGPGYEECPDEAFTTLDVNALSRRGP